jgi:hypothetical protein
MKCLFHIGTEKTGSSYLQKLSAKNRPHLEHHGVFFPHAGRDEKRLQEGTISPGNARELAELITAGEWPGVGSWLSERVAAARARDCSSLLLSHELLFVAMARPDATRRLQQAMTAAGATALPSALLVVRDPASHALSLYKHRAKDGRIGDIESWLGTSYRTPEDIQAFLEVEASGRVELTLRRYKKDAAVMERMFFDEWLEIPAPPVRIETTVNPSLSLSELRALRHLAARCPLDVPRFYSQLLKVPRSKKASDAEMEDYASSVCAAHVARFPELWDALAERLAEDGGLQRPSVVDPAPAQPEVLHFTDAQLLAWASAHAECSVASYGVRALGDRLRRLGGMIKAPISARWERRGP